MQKTVIKAFHFLNEAWQAYVIGKNYDYLSHIASNLQGRALSGCSSQKVEVLLLTALCRLSMESSLLHTSSLSAISITPACQLLPFPQPIYSFRILRWMKNAPTHIVLQPVGADAGLFTAVGVCPYKRQSFLSLSGLSTVSLFMEGSYLMMTLAA